MLRFIRTITRPQPKQKEWTGLHPQPLDQERRPRREQKKRWFRNGQKWRTDCEGRISVVKRRHGLDRCHHKSFVGMERWFTPHAKEAGKEALGRAASLIRHGDRSTMLTILGAVAVAGWVMARTYWAPPLVSPKS